MLPYMTKYYFCIGRAERQTSARVVSTQLHWASASLGKGTHACLSIFERQLGTHGRRD